MKHIRNVLCTVALVALVGCSHGSANSNSAAASSSPGGAEATAASSDANAGANASADGATTTVDTSKLGAPVYPGAQVGDETNTVTATAMGGTAATFKTTDSFDQVTAFYEQKLPSNAKHMKMSAGGSSIASYQFSSSDGSTTTQVTVTARAGQTAIMIVTAPIHK